MKFSKASCYALHALMYMVRHITLLPIGYRVIARLVAETLHIRRLEMEGDEIRPTGHTTRR